MDEEYIESQILYLLGLTVGVAAVIDVSRVGAFERRINDLDSKEIYSQLTA